MANSAVCPLETARGDRAGDGMDVLRDAMTLVLQELIELEATQVIGAAGTSALTSANASQTAKAGDIEQHIPSSANAPSCLACPSRTGGLTGRRGQSSWSRTSTGVDPQARRPGAGAGH